MRAAAVLVALVLMAGCSNGGEGDGAGAFVESMVVMDLRDQHGRLWDVLHPEFQDLIDRDGFIKCRRQMVEEAGGPLVQLDNVRVIETYNDRVTLPETGEADATAVTYEARVSFGGESVTQTATARVLDVNGDWRWNISDPEDYVDC